MHTASRTNQIGFTLVEIMVAMVIGMLGILIIMQMAFTFEGQKRTTTGGGDAQNAAAIAMFGLQQNLLQAGYCFSSSAPTRAGIGSLKPVMIDVATLDSNLIRAANTNTLLVSYGNDACPPESASGVASATTMNVIAFAVRGNQLWQCDYLASDCATVGTNWTVIADDIVGLRAECDNGNGVRLALVARSPQLEKTAVTTLAPTWSGTAAIDLSATVTDSGYTWQNYRYKVVESLIPNRNTLWTGGQGC
ncbi:MAG: prepilin-type N-terminal cleavage/methylation domain-containing protein [Pseudomonadota bacterium]